MRINTATSITVPQSRDRIFDASTSSEMLVRALLPYGPIAGVARSEMLDGRPLEQGARRRVTLTDGTVLVEDILEHDVPTRHRYKWTSGLKPPFAWLVNSGEGTFTFSDVEGGTQIEWTYTFELKSPLAYPLALPITGLFKRWQARGLARAREELSKHPAGQAASRTSASAQQDRARV